MKWRLKDEVKLSHLHRNDPTLTKLMIEKLAITVIDKN